MDKEASTEKPRLTKSKKSTEQPLKHAPKSKVNALLRRQSLVKGLLEGKTIKDIAQTLDLSPKTAENQCSQMLREPQTQRSFVRILEQRGLTDDFLAKKAQDLLEAQTPHFFSKDGVVCDERYTPAHETQRKTLELLSKWKGHLKEQATTDVSVGLMQVVINAMNNPEGK